MSVIPQNDRLIMIIRTREGSHCLEVTEGEMHPTDYISLAKQIYPNLRIDRLETCTNIRAQELIKAFDEKLETKKFKFGIIYQRKGQVRPKDGRSGKAFFVCSRLPKKNSSITKNTVRHSTNFSTFSLREFL